MKKLILVLSLVILTGLNAVAQFVPQYKVLDGNNLKTFIYDTGIFDQDMRNNNTPAMEWPKNSGKFATFTTGLTVAAKVNGNIRMAAGSFRGEYAPGFINSNGVAETNSNFKLYRVSKNDNNSNPDYANWGLMVPYGAPYTDMNNNGQFDAGIDKPGITGADQTIFVCLTDGFPESHSIDEGFGGGTAPLFAQVAATFWSFDLPGLKDVYFAKWDVTNRSSSMWEGAYFSILADIDIGLSSDDYIGCDTIRQLSYSYNRSNMDGTGNGSSYGANPPSVGVILLSSPRGMTSSTTFINLNLNPPPCEMDPYGEALGAYNMMRGYKKDGTPWLDATTGPNFKTTKYIYSGIPQTGAGWTQHDGYVNNCGGSLTGSVLPFGSNSDTKSIISSGSDDHNITPGQTKTMLIGKIIARGTDNLNSVSQLTIVSDDIKQRYQAGQIGVVGVTPIQEIIPSSYRLEQNFPNPFNPSTNIRFAIPSQGKVKLTVYDALGKEVAVLVNSELSAGTYEADFNASKLSSGIYYYTLSTEGFTETKKMLLIK